ncbi:zinc finger protein 37-like [Mya arenaria]|uniref:zinc finger protein 37-like n=1 Tax=Mya arenaria TaxID=6604 RepID=UPI0022E0AF7A|nr:zinc finger protein 37-like [Mya arenaria]
MAHRKKPRMTRLSPTSKLIAEENKKEKHKVWSQTRHTIQVSTEVWDIWNEVKKGMKIARNDEFAMRLLECARRNETGRDLAILEKTPVEASTRTTPMAEHSTPACKAEPRFPVSDISETSMGFNRVEEERNPMFCWKPNNTTTTISRRPEHIPDLQAKLELHWNQVLSLSKLYSSFTIRGIPLFTSFKARFDQTHQPNNAPSTFILIPFAPQPGTEVLDISNGGSTSGNIGVGGRGACFTRTIGDNYCSTSGNIGVDDRGVCFTRTMGDNNCSTSGNIGVGGRGVCFTRTIGGNNRSTSGNTGVDDRGACSTQTIGDIKIVKTETIHSFPSTDIESDIDIDVTTCSDSKLDSAFDSNEEPSELLSFENHDYVKINDYINDRGSESDEEATFETYLANKNKVKYFHHDDDEEQSKLSLRKSNRIRTVGFRPNYSALELPSSSEEDSDSGQEIDLSDEEIEIDVDSKGESAEGQKKNNNKSKEDKDYKPDDKDDKSKEGPDYKSEDVETEGNNGVDKNVENPQTLKRKNIKDNDPDFDLDDIAKQEKYKKRRKRLNKEILGYKSGENVNGRRKKENNAAMMKKRNLMTLNEDIAKLKETNKWITVDLDNEKDNFEMVECNSTAQKDRNTNVIEMLYSCLICKALQTDNRTEFQNHVENHVNGVLKCAQCGCECRDPRTLLKHERTVHNIYGQNQVNVCEVCGVGFMANKSYKRHMSREHLQAAWNCQYCSEKFMSLNLQHLHQREKHTDKFDICQMCNKYFFGKGKSFEKHVNHCDGIGIQRQKQCKECGKSFHPGKLQTHIKTVHQQLRRFQCKYCSYSGKNSTNLKHHLLIHEGRKPNTCQDCGQSFTQPYQLTSHMRTHTGEKPFKCDQCPYAAAWNVQLKDHKKAHDSDQAVTCPHCGIVLKNNTCLNTHIKKAHSK